MALWYPGRNGSRSRGPRRRGRRPRYAWGTEAAMDLGREDRDDRRPTSGCSRRPPRRNGSRSRGPRRRAADRSVSPAIEPQWISVARTETTRAPRARRTHREAPQWISVARTETTLGSAHLCAAQPRRNGPRSRGPRRRAESRIRRTHVHAAMDLGREDRDDTIAPVTGRCYWGRNGSRSRGPRRPALTNELAAACNSGPQWISVARTETTCSAWRWQPTATAGRNGSRSRGPRRHGWP